jgi:hypothetical protein
VQAIETHVNNNCEANLMNIVDGTGVHSTRDLDDIPKNSYFVRL